jgi:threonine dehydratase
MESTQEIDVRQEVLDADKRIRPQVLETPMERSIYLSDLIEGTVYLKLDVQQTTGSFKFRGASSKINSLSEEEIEDAIRVLFEQHRLVTEGSAALSVAYLLKHPERFRGRTVVPVVCGKNIGTERFKSIIT